MKTTKFKPSEIGPIPEEWEVKRLGNLWTRFKTGPFGSSLHASDYVQNGVPLINPMHLLNGKIVPSEGTSVDEGTAHRLSEYRLATNDVIIARRGEIGRVALVTSHEDGWLCGTGCFFVHFKDSLHTPYLAWYLRTPQCAGQLVGEAVGTTLINLNRSILERTWIPLPPLCEQVRIAEVLDDADAWIESLDKLIQKKKLIKQGSMQALLSGKTRLPGFRGKWVKKTFGDFLIRIATGLNPRQNFKLNNGGNNYYVTIKDFGEGCINFDACDKIDGDALRLINERSDLRAGDMLFSSIGRVGDAYVIKVPPTNWNINESVFSLRPNTSVIDSVFMYYLVKSESVQECLLSGITGSTLTGIKIGELREILCCFPGNLAEQKVIATLLSDMDAELAALSREKSKAEQIKQGMMQELLTGRVRLVEGE